MDEQQAIDVLNMIEAHGALSIQAKEKAIEALKTVKTMKDRKLRVEHIEEYAKFEDECISKGYTFSSLLAARDKQEVQPLEERAHPNYKCMGKMYYCKCGVAYLDNGSNYCGNCGQKLRKE